MSCPPVHLSTRHLPLLTFVRCDPRLCLRSQTLAGSLDGRLTGISLPPKTPRPCEVALENVKMQWPKQVPPK